MPWALVAGKYIAEKLVSKLSDRAIDASFKYLAKIHAPGLTTLHFAELRSKVMHMPFIYEGLDSEVLTDFVDIDMTTLDLDLVRKPPQPFEMSYEQRMANHKHVMLFGRGGVGKTTYLRRTILDIIGAKGRPRLSDHSPIVPFYVPLKAIDNSEKLPVLNYLLRDNSLLAHGNVGKLASLARTSKLMLCLDGYDEIPFASASMEKSPIMKELAFLTGAIDPEPDDLLPDQRDDCAAFYHSMTYSRLWITSRLEFYNLNRFPLSRGVLAVEITGVPAQNRAKLVKRIFDRYRGQLNKLGIEVSHENFIQRVERSGRDELIALSFNPLFLTVMAYIYVSRVIKERRYDVGLVEDVMDLINECVNLLLFDLDEARARDLPPAHRDGLLSRRNEWIPEKRDFLGFFALGVMLAAQPTFTEQDIAANARSFFQSKEPSTDRTNILRSIEQPSSLPGFVDQLIFCGIFVQIARSGSTISYDFPHRKFREVLGGQYLEGLDKPLATLQEFVDRPQLEESLYGIFESTTLKDRIVERLLSKATLAVDRRPGIALKNCIERVPYGYDPTKVLWDFFFTCLREHKSFTIPVSVLLRAQPSPEVLLRLADILKQAVIDADVQRVALSSEIIRWRFGPEVITPILEQQLNEGKIPDVVFVTVLFEYLSAQSVISAALLARLCHSKERSLDIGVSLAACVARTKQSRYAVAFREFTGGLGNKSAIQLLYVAAQVDSVVISRLSESAGLEPSQEAAAWLCQKWTEAAKTRPALVVTLPAIIDAVESWHLVGDRPKYLRLLLPLRGSLHQDADSILRSTESSATGSSSEAVPILVRQSLVDASKLDGKLFEEVAQEIGSLHYTPNKPLAFFDSE